MGVEGEGGGGTNGFHDHHMPDSPVSHDDGYFTSAVSVQHKVSSNNSDTSSYGTIEFRECMNAVNICIQYVNSRDFLMTHGIL